MINISWSTNSIKFHLFFTSWLLRVSQNSALYCNRRVSGGCLASFFIPYNAIDASQLRWLCTLSRLLHSTLTATDNEGDLHFMRGATPVRVIFV